MKYMKANLLKYKNFLLYIFFGIITTFVNIAAYLLFTKIFNFETMISNIIAWILAVTVAYLTNRNWVFESTASNLQDIIKEIFSFFICRLLTGFLDMAIMFICVNLLGLNDIIIKCLANIIVILANYIASKMVIFKKTY